jgi:hypothetical protein
MGTSLCSGSKSYHSKPRKTTPPFSSVLSHDSQMRRYRNQKSLTPNVQSRKVATTTTDPPTRPAPVSKAKPVRTRFQVQDSVYDKKSTYNELSVEVEFEKYISGSTSSEEMGILRFWEVRYD